MRLKIFNLLFLFLVCSQTNAQFFFIPIIIPGQVSYVSHSCPSRNGQANDYMLKGIENIKKNITLSFMYFKGAIKNDSMFCDAYDYLAICFMRSKQYDSAMNYINQSIKINSSNFWVLKTKGFIYYWDMKDYNSAALYFSEQHQKQKDEPV